MTDSEEDKQKFNKDLGYLVEILSELIKQYNDLLLKGELNSEEDEALKTIQEFLLSLGAILPNAISELNEDLYGKSVGLYYAFKEAAINGDPNAQIIIKELKPMFEDSLGERLNMN